uniref:Protein kinase domain-containing protein n=1 Tax=Panagrolaimus superbus TaxID=310955 RepID=A0A914Z3W6_9BILA
MTKTRSQNDEITDLATTSSGGTLETTNTKASTPTTSATTSAATSSTATTAKTATTDRSTSSSESRKKPEYEIGTIIDGKWKVLSELGRGGCGIVYCVERCDDSNLEHPKAALKAEYVLKHYTETLAAEANILRKLQWSRHVCQLFACGRISNEINIVCMSLAGPSLSYLRRHSPQQRMTFSTGLRIAFHCLNAIEDLHCIGFLHRDIKASNFAIGYYASETRIIRILDFGFARSYVSTCIFGGYIFLVVHM